MGGSGVGGSGAGSGGFSSSIFFSIAGDSLKMSSSTVSGFFGIFGGSSISGSSKGSPRSASAICSLNLSFSRSSSAPIFGGSATPSARSGPKPSSFLTFSKVSSSPTSGFGAPGVGSGEKMLEGGLHLSLFS